MGVAFPIALLLVFGVIGNLEPGTVGSSGLTVIDLWVPTIIVIGVIGTATISLPAN